jgi:molybdopterin-synthase adenylyltransferase
MATTWQCPSSATVRLRQRVQLVPVGDVLIVRLGSRRLRIAGYGPVEERMLGIVAVGCARSDLTSAIASLPPGERHRATDLLDLLDGNHLLEDVGDPGQVGHQDLSRFDRLLNFLSELEIAADSGLTRHQLLAQLIGTTIGVVGAGGLGSWILYGLACCGVGRIVIMDADYVEASNLNRSILYCEADIGKPKADVAATALRRFWPRCAVAAIRRRVESPDDLADLAGSVDLVVGAADQPRWLIREWLAQACRHAGVPLIHPSGLRVGPFYIPGKTACPMCEWAQLAEQDPRYPDIIDRSRRLPRGNSGGLAPWASMTASVTVMEIFRYLTGLDQLVTKDAVWRMTGDYVGQVDPLPPHPACRVCHGEAGKVASPGREAV